MKLVWVFIAVIISSASASELDQRLQSYIEKFNLQPLQAPTGRNLELMRLGQALFMDRILSGNNNISCADCHHPRVMTHDRLPLGLGEGASGLEAGNSRRIQKRGKILARNTPALFNLAEVNLMFWDGRVSYDPQTQTFITPLRELNGVSPLREDITKNLKSALAAQAIFPLVNHEEMLGEEGSNPIASAPSEFEAWDLIVKKVLAYPQYKKQFEKVFPGEEINIGHFGQALAEFQKHAFFFADTPFDNYLQGDREALTEVQKIGMDVFFNKGKCGECHSGPHLTNFEFHSIGIPQIGPGKENGDDFGRYEWDPREENLYAFRVPPLRNVSQTAPYMHDGAFKTIPQVIEHYDMIEESLTAYQLVNNWKNYLDKLADHDHSQDSKRISALSSKLTKRLEFEEEEEKALAEFLLTALTDKRFLNQEVAGDYRTYFRLQLKKSGFDKLSQQFQGIRQKETYYDFDLLWEGSFALRNLENPMRLIIIKKPEGPQLIYRQQVHKAAQAQQGIIIDTAFQRQEQKEVDPLIFAPIEDAYLDMFRRIYTYKDGIKNDPIPLVELSVIQSNVNFIKDHFQQIEFQGKDQVSDQVNKLKEELFFVPTSFNEKEVMLFETSVMGKKVEGNLQKSLIRTATGGFEVTYALELETGKITKSQLPTFSSELAKNLKVLAADDVGGGSPSPADLTLEILKEVVK